MEKEFYWCLIFDNYHDDYYTEYFDTKENAVAAFEEICEVCKDHDEFERRESGCSWFDPMWNEYSTCVYLAKLSMPAVNNSAISLYFDRDYEKEDYTG